MCNVTCNVTHYCLLLSSGGVLIGRPREGDDAATEDIHFRVTPVQKVIYDSWGKDKNRILRDYIAMRALGKDEAERRLAELNQIIGDAEDERGRIQATLEDVVGPLQEKATALATRYFNHDIFNLPPDQQRARIDGWCGDDDTLAAMAWDIIREKGGWGGD